jgi:hypothetical protein
MKTRLSALFILGAVATWFAWQAANMPESMNPSDVGPGRIPLILASAALILLVSIAIGTWRQRASAAGSESASFPRPGGTLLALCGLGLTALTIVHVGMYAGCTLMVAAILLAAGERRWWVIALCAAGFNLFAWLCFARLLQVPLQ